jgi:endonuclease V-like protein UPF0215 family
VETVVVAGRLVVEGGAITTLDEQAVRARGRDATRRFWDMIRTAAR